MPYHDDTDRYCTVCHGTRRLTDTATHEYAYSAFSSATCWACAVPSEPTVTLGPDALMDAAFGSREARMAWDAERWAEYHGERA